MLSGDLIDLRDELLDGKLILVQDLRGNRLNAFFKQRYLQRSSVKLGLVASVLDLLVDLLLARLDYV